MRYREITRGPGSWKHLQIQRSGKCYYIGDSGALDGFFDLGLIVTGRSRVFAGVFVQATTPSGEIYCAEDERSFVTALRELRMTLSREGGWLLDAIGCDKRFYQTGLTSGSDWGYHPSCEGAVQIFSRNP